MFAKFKTSLLVCSGIILDSCQENNLNEGIKSKIAMPFHLNVIVCDWFRPMKHVMPETCTRIMFSMGIIARFDFVDGI